MGDSQILVKETYSITSLDPYNFNKWPIPLLNSIKECIGKPYKYGCFDNSGYDCYTLVYYLYSLVGMKLPKENIASFNLKVHTKLIDAQLINFLPICYNDRQPFDVIMFKSYHLGVVLDKHLFIHVNFDTPVVLEYFLGNIETGFIRKIYRWNF